MFINVYTGGMNNTNRKLGAEVTPVLAQRAFKCRDIFKLNGKQNPRSVDGWRAGQKGKATKRLGSVLDFSIREIPTSKARGQQRVVQASKEDLKSRKNLVKVGTKGYNCELKITAGFCPLFSLCE